MHENSPVSPGSKRFSKQGFHQLQGSLGGQPTNMAQQEMGIPLQQVVTGNSTTGLRRGDSTTRNASGGDNSSFGEKHHRGRGPGGRRRGAGNVDVDGEENKVTRMGRIYYAILNFSIITRYFIYVLPLALCIAAPIVIGATVAPKAKIGGKNGVRIVWFFTWVEIVWLSLWISKIVAHFLPKIFQALAGVVSSGTRKYSLVIQALEIPLSLIGWAATSLTTFIPLMTLNPDQLKSKDPNDKGTKPWQETVKLILAACLAASLVFFAEKLLVQLISINYHRKQFNLKIKDSKHSIYLLSLLYDASRSLFPPYCNEFAEEDYIIQDSIALNIGAKRGNGAHSRSGSATPLRILQDVGRFGDKLTSVFGNVAHEITGKKVFNPDSSHSVVVEALEKARSSEALARRLWMSFVVEGREALYQDDIVEVMGPNKRDEAEEAFASLDRDNNGDISLEEMILTVTELGRERKAIASSMHDVDQAIHVLDSLLSTVVFIMIVFIFIAFLNKNFVTTLATAGTALLSLSFVFAGTAQEVLGSCIFLFVKHPFDIGDRVDVTKDQLIVEHISLLFTQFKRVSSNQTIQIPNIVLNSLWIENVSRSKAVREQVAIFVNFDTSFEDITALKNEMLSFVLDKENNRDFQPDLDIEVVGIAEMNKLELRVEIRHKSNWANETIRAARRSKFMCALVLALRKVPIYGPSGGDIGLGDASKPSYSVTVSYEQAQAAREKWLAEKEAKRMFPSTKPTVEVSDPEASDVLGPPAETNAISKLNSRPPARDLARDDGWTSARDDASTLGRPSTDRADIEEVRGLLRRETNRGKRRADDSSAALSVQQSNSLRPQVSVQTTTTYGSYPQQPDYANGLSPTASRPQDQYVSPIIPGPQGNAFAQAQQMAADMSPPPRENNPYARPPQARSPHPQDQPPYRTYGGT